MDVVITITEYKKQLTALGYAESTIENYRKNLDLFKRYLEGRNISDLRKVTNQIILDYQSKVMSETIAMESKALKIRPVKRLFEYLVASHKLLINPSEGIVETSRKNRKTGTILTVNEMNRLLAQPNLSLKTHIRVNQWGRLCYYALLSKGLLVFILYAKKSSNRRNRCPASCNNKRN